MISGKGAGETARGKRNAFWNTLEELHKYFDRIDVIAPRISNNKLQISNEFPNVHFHEKYDGQQANVMTVQEYAPFRNGRLAKKIWEKTKIPYVLEIHHIPGYPKSASIKEWLAKIATRFYIARDARNASAVRVVNQTQVPQFLIKAGIPQDKIKYVSSMYIDLDIFKPMNLEKKYDAIFVGRRASNKGIEIFDRACQLSKVKCLVVDGWAKDSQEIATLLNQSKMLIMPSYNEGGPRVVLEALACGIPVLATPVGIVPEIVSSEFIIDWSARKIAKKIKAILAGELYFIKPDLSRFEKKEAIKAYAEFLRSFGRS